VNLFCFNYIHLMLYFYLHHTSVYYISTYLPIFIFALFSIAKNVKHSHILHHTQYAL